MASQNFYKFLLLALHAIKASKGGKLIKWLYLLGGFILFTIIADVFGIPLVNAFKLLPLYGWVIIILVISILSLLLLLKGAHLLHNEESASVNNIFDKHNLEWGTA
jgi:membrane protein implicated in regulation of membrane protease activity